MFRSQEEKNIHTKKEEGKQETIIAQGVSVEGDFHSKGNVFIEGDVSGSLHTEKDLHVGEQASIRANIVAQNALIAGRVEGNIQVKGSLQLESSCIIQGDMSAAAVSISSGAFINGKISMGERDDAQAEKLLSETKNNFQEQKQEELVEA